MQVWLVTGGCGFIGSNFVLMARRHNWCKIINLDKLTYASNPQNLASLAADPNYVFVKGDIGDRPLLNQIFTTYKPDAVVHFAAESHVDRSIQSPEIFIQTNVLGTFQLLEASLKYWQDARQEHFRFLQVSTDEVYGSLGPDDAPFTERSPYQPNSPYAASKASADHLVRSYNQTYGLPTLCTNCSNNYGPYQFPEKLIPLMILNAIAGQPLPVYGDGLNVRDWLYVEDHCQALYQVLQSGTIGETYNIGGNNEWPNIEVVRTICRLLERHPDTPQHDYLALITFVGDRLGHDRRYAIDCSKIQQTLYWQPQITFSQGLHRTIDWYLESYLQCQQKF